MRLVGPGLLFASAAIGTSHLVLSTRAGAHHGFIVFWVIILTLLLKYPFYQMGPRYSLAMGNSILTGYRLQGRWAVGLFIVVVFINMFAVTGAVAAVSAGLLSTMGNLSSIPMPALVGIIITLTTCTLLLGGYRLLDNFIKLISVVLLVTVTIAFVSVVIKGPVDPVVATVPLSNLFEGAGLLLLVGLIGWMPAGMEASTMNSIWVVEKMRTTQQRLTMKEGLFDFNLGYGFTTLLALMFMSIGALSIYGSGELLEGNSTQVANRVLNVFADNIGSWSYWIIAIAAFGTIYGTLITVMDAFTRCIVHGVMALKTQDPNSSEISEAMAASYNWFYKAVLVVLGVGGFALFYFFQGGMIQILQFATVIGFVGTPIIAWLNLKATLTLPEEGQPSKQLYYLAYAGLAANSLFSVYYLFYRLL